MFKKSLALVALILSVSSQAAEITYNINSTLAGGVATGTITTDGTIGELVDANITGWSLSVDVNGDGTSATASSSDSNTNTFLFLPLGYSPLSASATSLIFDFAQDHPLTGGGGIPGIRLRSSIPKGQDGEVVYWEVRSVSTMGDTSRQGILVRERHVVSGVDTNLNSFTSYTGALEIASVSAVPLPAAAWLFGSALLGLGVVKRKKA
jgi:hypothetical protein